MSASARAELLSRWIKPSSENDQVQQERAEDMVRKAITTCDAFDGTNVLIYTKGSYPNNTNVRRDSDVDVVIELRDCLYYGYKAGVTGAEPSLSPYRGSWTPESWRRAVVDALVTAFGPDSVDTSGRVAINISAVEGSRPILLEIQALVCRSNLGIPRRTAAGTDINRVNLLMAVLEKRLGLSMSSCDAYINIAGGIRMNEPAVDLGIVLAMISSYKDCAIPEDVICFGEVGLSGEVRAVNMAKQRVAEAKKLGFSTCILPKVSLKGLEDMKGIRLIGVENVQEAMRNILQ